MDIWRKNITHLRNQKGFSQEKMGDELGLLGTTYGAYEQGRNEPGIEILIRISEYFDISIDELLKKKLYNG